MAFIPLDGEIMYEWQLIFWGLELAFCGGRRGVLNEQYLTAQGAVVLGVLVDPVSKTDVFGFLEQTFSSINMEY